MIYSCQLLVPTYGWSSKLANLQNIRSHMMFTKQFDPITDKQKYSHTDWTSTLIM